MTYIVRQELEIIGEFQDAQTCFNFLVGWGIPTESARHALDSDNKRVRVSTLAGEKLTVSKG